MPQGLVGIDQRIRAGWPRQYQDAEPLTCLSIHFLQGRCQWMDSCATWAEKKMESFHLRNWIWTKTCLSPCPTISSIPHTTPTSQVRGGRVLTGGQPYQILLSSACCWETNVSVVLGKASGDLGCCTGFPSSKPSCVNLWSCFLAFPQFVLFSSLLASTWCFLTHEILYKIESAVNSQAFPEGVRPRVLA